METIENNANREKWFARVAALLAKAESTDSQEEAATFAAKAQELIEKHAFDEAEIAAARGQSARGTGFGDYGAFDQQIIQIPGSYTKVKAILLGAVARSNNVLVVGVGKRRENPNSGFDRCRLYGYEEDRKMTLLMFASLLIFGEKELAKAEVPAWDNARSFRQGFWNGFASTVGHRLMAAKAEARRTAVSEGVSSTALALVDNKLNEVTRKAREELGARWRGGSASSSGSGAGRGAGRAAGDRADLGGTRRVGGGGSRALGAGR